MRKILTLFGVLLCLCCVTTTIMAQNGQFDVRFAIKNYDCANNSVTIQVQVKAHDAAHTFLMGDANYRFDYDPRVINTPTLISQEMFSNQAPASDFNYNAQNLNGSSAGLTLGTVSLNTIYGGGGNAAKLVPATWTTVSCIRFTVQDPTKCFDLLWHDDTRFPITGMNEIEILGGGAYGQYIVPAAGIFTNYSACVPQVCGGVTALNDINNTLKNTAVSGNLLTNDNSPYTLTANSTPFLSPSHGTLTIGANGVYTYTPVSGYVGTDVAKYIVCNTAGLCDTASLFLNVLDVPVANVNSTPIAQNDNGVTYTNMAVTGNVLANDIDPEKNTLTVNTIPLSMPTNGTLVLNADGSYVYTPFAGFVGTDSFQYTVCDNGSPSQCSTATVSIEVLNNTTGGSLNLPPTANDDSYLTYKNTNLSGNLKSNDADPNVGQTLTYNATPIANPAHGVVTINTDGTFTYVPTTGYLGPDAFQYAVCDNGSPSKCDTATAFVVISTAPNQAPVVTVTAQNILEDVSTTFCLPITDANVLDTHTVTVCGVIGGGTATAVVNNVTHQVCVTYLSALNYNGAASVCLNVCDNGTPSKCDNVTVPITVTPVNDKPIIAIVNPLTTPEDVPIVFCATIADVDAGSSFTSTSCGATHGTVATVINGSQVCVTYTPTLNFNGLDSACVIVCDNGNPTLCDTLHVKITVTPVNDNPVIVDLTPQTTLEDTPLNVCTTINDVDNDSPIFSATLCGVTNGTATPSVSGNQLCLNFVPTANYNGAATVCVIICDNGSPSKCDTMNVAITVTPVNDAPVLTAVTPKTTLEDTPITFCTTINDVDVGQSFTATPCGVTNGTISTTVVGNQLCMTYTPNLDYNGAETICVNVCDNGSPSLCAQITVPITVTPVNDNPVIVDLTPKTTLEDTPLTVCTTINDVDVSSSFTATLCGVANGTATTSIVGNQMCIAFSPTLNYNGPASVCVIVCDNGSPSKCDTMNVAITVTPVNDAPVLTAVTSKTTLEDTPITFCTTINDVDVGQSFTATPCGVTNGTLTTSVVGNQLCMTYTPNLNYNGPESICVNVCDNGSPSLCAQITVPITVTPVNDNPVIVDLTPQTILEDTPLTICTTINDVDVSSAFTATLCGVTNGTATPSVVGNQLCINYTPTLNFNGVATVCVIVCDNGSPSKCDTTTLTINVMPVNDKPVVTVVPIVVSEDGTTTVCMPITDPDVGNTFSSTSCGVLHGTVSTAIVAGQVCVTYTPAANYYGIDSACVIVCDNGSPSKCDTIKAPITVTPVNDAPIVPDGTATTLNSAPVTICVPIVDVDPLDTHTVSVCGAPTMGSISTVINNATHQLCVTYTPNLVAVGMDIVCLNVCDNGSPSKCDVTNLTFNIGSTNKPPVAMNDINSTLKNMPVSGNVLTNDSDPNSNTLTVSTTPVQAPSHGTVVLNANGTYTYTPAANFVGTDVFKYQMCDNGVPSMCTTASVTIEIREVLTAGTNQAPVARWHYLQPNFGRYSNRRDPLSKS
jgi:VCBS repeat-containing protein